MDRHGELVKWLRKMGYDGEIPDSLDNVHNNSTSFIWEQLMQNARPKQEVKLIRNNIIVHRLKSKPINKQDEFSSPIAEIALYQKKEALKYKLECIYSTIKEKENIYTNTCQNIKMKSIAIEKLNEKIRANEEREYILRQKDKVSQGDIQSAEDTLKSLGNLTPVELEEKPNTREITQTLQKCAEILEKQLHTFSVPVKKNQNCNNASASDKSQREPSLFKQYLSTTEKEMPMKTNSSIKKGKENSGLKNITRCLFDGNVKQSVEPKKRESLGLLSESFMNSSELDDLLVEGYPSVSVIQEELLLDEESFLFRKNERENTLVLPNTILGNKNDNLNKMCDNEEVNKQLKDMLRCHNRQMIWNVFQSLDNSMHLDVSKELVLDHRKKGDKINKNDISQLQFLHVQTEFKILKQKAMLKQLQHQVDSKMKNIQVSMSNKGVSTEKFKKLFDLFCNNANLDATLTAIKKEITAAKTSQEKIDLLIVSGKLAKVKDNIEAKLFSIQKNLGNVQEVLTSINRTREETIACVHKLVPFIDDMSWSSPLVENFISKEIKTFERFPLGYNRRSIHIDPSVFYRDLCTSTAPHDQDIDDETLYILAKSLDNPLSFPEIVVYNILKSKVKLEVLKSLRRVPEVTHQKKYTFENLQSQESYVQYALERLNSLIHSTSTMRTLSSASSAKKAMDIWLEMPLKDFISPNIKVDGHEYSYYEKQYDTFYNNL